MKHKLLHIVTAVTLLPFPNVNFAQAPTLGTAANFVLFSTNGAATQAFHSLQAMLELTTAPALLLVM